MGFYASSDLICTSEPDVQTGASTKIHIGSGDRCLRGLSWGPCGFSWAQSHHKVAILKSQGQIAQDGGFGAQGTVFKGLKRWDE